MRATTFAVVLTAVLGCGRTPDPGEPLNDSRDLAALFDGRTETMYVRAGLADTLLGLLAAKREEDGRYSALLKDRPVVFAFVEVEQPRVYSPEQWGWYDTTKAFISKIYFESECGQGHPGFVAPCMATFGPHRAFGNSMTWQVNNWKSCTRGKSWCVEVWKPVGTITYYPDFSCSDSIFVTRPIMEFRCD